jgi:hypothetical protein
VIRLMGIRQPVHARSPTRGFEGHVQVMQGRTAAHQQVTVVRIVSAYKA